jgi:tRNA 2-thiouridine synthesizing protein A
MGVNKTQIEVLDLIGLKCPLPALYARRALERGGAGATITVLSDDPMAAVDLPHMCHQEGFIVLSTARRDAVLELTLHRPA